MQDRFFYFSFLFLFLYINMIYKIFLLALATCMPLVLCGHPGEFEQKHMSESHNIEIQDEVAFFKIHDLNQDGFWDEEELKSMYGLERDIDPNAQHIKLIIDRVFQDMDLNRDRLISLDEYINAKLPMITEKQQRVEEEEKKKQKPIKAQPKEPVFNQNKESTGTIPSKFRA
ncbi:uncharacterized protein B0P05DRAFT_565071 [Gilbertella persicaria]|uniref:uncharacterized protein n=1 Tax=Gilbertella persicaria TaxID=101096 RepID=UPI00222109D6|nr:uncharacterized protein B0P05DRAFT_565071 [Gilbertella persicaria]KAI8047963.1 hypothetical protein B0P05DRAFT_565071 [Gilbertella persicaria]